MADNRIIKTSEQFLYSGVGPLDSKQAPVQSASELNTLTAYEGQRIYVINDGCDYVFKRKGWKYQWVKEEISEISSKVDKNAEDIKQLSGSVVTIETKVDKIASGGTSSSIINGGTF
jgi:hypothetical protein